MRASLAPAGPDPLIGRLINDRFRVVALIARGGMGKVYRAEQAPLGRAVALKVLNPNYSGENDPEFHKRFFLEASTCSKLTHPNTVTIFDYGRADDDIYYIAMELLEGVTLHRMLKDGGALSPARAMHIARQVCRSLREAHNLGVIHRDLKPANIFLMRHGDENDYVKVLDFGLVKDLDNAEDITQTGLFMGSPKYMSPEQIRGEKVDGRADVYSLGVILYEMLTGKVPFDRPNSVNILMAHVHEPAPPIREVNPACEASDALIGLVMRALAKDPDQRFEGMDAMLIALKHLDGVPLTMSTELGITGSYAPGPPSSVGTPRSDFPSAPLTDDTTPRPSIARIAIPLAVAVIGAMALGAAGLVAVLSSNATTARNAEESEPRAQVSLPVTPPTTTREGAASTDPEAAIVRTMVALRSEPAGATVEVDGQAYGPTPADVEWTGADAARGRRVTFLFRLDGHRDYSVTRVITGAEMSVEADLVPIRHAVRPPVRRPPPRPRNDSVRPVHGYKLDPY